MIIIDIEASGIDEVKHAILSVGAIDFDNPKNQFYEECQVFKGAHIMDEALVVNGFTKEQATDVNKQTDEELVKHFIDWTKSVNEHTFAGQNPSFDRDFLHRAADRYHIEWPFAYRTLDLHSVCYTHMIKKGIVPPVAMHRSDLNSDKIMQYVGIPIETHPHNALNGAKIAAEALFRLLYSKNFLPEYENFPLPIKIR
jgi:DNA polymerase III epsilon subunit-like protein